MARKQQDLNLEYGFFNILQDYYKENKGRIKRNYTDLTRKFLNYNDRDINPNAFLRKPQFEALEIYVLIKEFFNNRQVSEIFEDYINQRNNFEKTSFYAHPDAKTGQITLLSSNAEQNKILFKQMKKYSETYPNYIYALTMGLGKTILIATCIFYEFLVANKNPKDKRFCHNALVFAPDKTVLESLREIVTFNKSLVVPPEYARVLDSNIKIHFLEDTGTTLNTLDNSDFNIIISNTQKIIVKRKQKKDNSTNKLFNMTNNSIPGFDTQFLQDLKDLYGDDSLTPDDLIFNQRFKKLCRLSQIGVYVDEAHHLFGADLEKAIRNKSDTSLRNTINQLSRELNQNGTSVIACYNYTGTPYIKNSILPEVVYSYGLNEAIGNEYLKDISLKGYDNVKNEEFLRDVIKEFWQIYGENTFEGLLPKLAIFGSNIEEIENEIKPVVEKILYELNIPISKILVNVGDNKITKSEDIRNFNNLDNVGTEGNKKQFLLLVNKGREGWNCRSLFGVAMYRTPKSKVFVLQATMRCLRQITDVQQKAKVFLSKENMDILENELNQNFRMTLDDLSNNDNPKKEQYHVRMLPPERYITLKSLQHIYSISKKDYCNPIDFNLKNTDFSKYQSLVYEKSKLSSQGSIKVINADNLKDSIKYSQYMLICEISRYLNIKCSIISKILNDALDGIDYILELINKYNDIIYDIIIPKIFESLYDISVEVQSKDKKVVLLREPKDKGYYNFNALPELVVSKDDFSMLYKERSFHADIYCFDSEPEKLCFYQYIWNLEKVKNVYFTGMFTNHQGELYIPYYDPDSKCVRNYYPDFVAEMTDGTIQLIEVKGDNKIDDIVVKAKANATIEVASKSNMEYVIYKSSDIMKNNIFENNDLIQHNLFTD